MISDTNNGVTRASLREQLRASTASFHRQADQIASQLLTSPDNGYERFLALSARAILPIERALNEANVVGVLADWPQRSRSAALQSDLEALSISVPHVEHLASDQLHDEAYQFGVLYVLEGSRLGGRVILHELLKVSGPACDRAHNYLSHGIGQPLWQTFLKRLEGSIDSRQRPESAIAGATFTFKRFIESSHHV